MIFQSLVIILPHFLTLKDHNEVPRQKFEVTLCGARNMMNKCAKFQGNTPHGYSSIHSCEHDSTFGDIRFCVQLCIETRYKQAISGPIWPTFLWIFSAVFTDAFLLLLYHREKKRQKWPKTNQWGPALNLFPANVPTREHDFFLISSRFHVENDVLLQILQLKNIPKLPLVEEKHSVFWFSALFSLQSFEEDNQVVFCLAGKRLIQHKPVKIEEKVMTYLKKIVKYCVLSFWNVW